MRRYCVYEYTNALVNQMKFCTKKSKQTNNLLWEGVKHKMKQVHQLLQVFLKNPEISTHQSYIAIC